MRVLILKLKIVESKKIKKLIEKTLSKTVLHKMDFSIREIIRETRAAINTRLDMLEMLIQNSKPMNQSNPVDLSNIENMLNLLTSKINSIEDKVNNIIHSKDEELPSIILNDNVAEEKKVVVCKKVEEVVEEKQEVIEEEQEVEEQEVVEEEQEVEEQEVVEEEQEEQEVVEEEQEVVEEEQEVVEEQELTEFEYKGMILYRDGENKVYQMDEDGELVDTPIGVWNETKQKVLRI